MMLFDIVLEENDKKDSWKHDISELNVLNTIFYIYYLYFLYNFRLFLWIHTGYGQRTWIWNTAWFIVLFYFRNLQKNSLLKCRLWLDVCAGTYSGGNKRKLSTAIALIGEWIKGLSQSDEVT